MNYLFLNVKYTILLTAFICISASAQDDGARAYKLAPIGSQNITIQGLYTRGNQALNSGTSNRDAKLDVDVAVFQYTKVFNKSAFFVVIPTGKVKGELNNNDVLYSSTSSGFGDIQFGILRGIAGMPSLNVKDYMKFRPDISIGVLSKVIIPSGEYNSNTAINLGANRYSFQIGFPTYYYKGESLVDPQLTTFEILPKITFFTKNNAPLNANSSTQKPIYALEGHISRGFFKNLWISGDFLYQNGGETRVDGNDSNDRRESLGMGVTANYNWSNNISTKFTYGDSIYSNKDGEDGYFFRSSVSFNY